MRQVNCEIDRRSMPVMCSLRTDDRNSGIATRRSSCRRGRAALAERLTGHFQVQHRAHVWVPADELFVELDTESRLARRQDVAVLPVDGLAQHLGVKPLP